MDRKRKIITMLLSVEGEDISSDEEAIIANVGLSVTDDGDDAALSLLIPKERVKRNCIRNYLEAVLPSYTDEEFRRHFRINRQLFHVLCEKFEQSHLFYELCEGKRFKASKNLLMFLWFAGHEACSFRDIGDRFDMSISSVSRIVERVTMFLSSLAHEIFEWPNESRKEEIASYFFEKSGFPKVIGAIDGTHIIIDPPSDGKDDYIDRKGNTSICLQGICDHEAKFLDVFIGFAGSAHDSRVYKNSFVYNKMDGLCSGFYILGDSAYPCEKSLLTPYRDNGHLTSAQKSFNRKLSSCRVVIEHSFGILKQRFRQLYYCKLRGMEKLCHFVRACCVLHNLANRLDLSFLENENNSMPEEMPAGDLAENESPDDTNQGKALRDSICRELAH